MKNIKRILKKQRLCWNSIVKWTHIKTVEKIVEEKANENKLPLLANRSLTKFIMLLDIRLKLIDMKFSSIRRKALEKNKNKLRSKIT